MQIVSHKDSSSPRMITCIGCLPYHPVRPLLGTACDPIGFAVGVGIDVGLSLTLERGMQRETERMSESSRVAVVVLELRRRV